MPLAYRYALYLAPAEPWRSAGAQWLGRCPETGLLVPPAAGADPRQPAWTAAPRQYGLHATLKAPFRLRAGRTPESLDDAALRLAANVEPFSVRLECRALRGFLAWRLAGARLEQAPMYRLAAEAVRQLDDWRAPPTEAELTRRRRSPLSPQHEAMLERWGYPYVFEHFTFHITLTGMLYGPEMQDAQARIRTFSDPLCRSPMPVNDICLYVQPEPDAPFLVARHYGFDGTVTDGIAAGYLQGPAAS